MKASLVMLAKAGLHRGRPLDCRQRGNDDTGARHEH